MLTQKVLRIVFVLMFAAGSAMFYGCAGEDHNHGEGGHDHEQVDETAGEESEATDAEPSGIEYTSAYVCPMHCEGSGSEEAGKCPVCGMDYVANADHEGDGHEHEGHEHDGHDHEHEGEGEGEGEGDA